MTARKLVRSFLSIASAIVLLVVGWGIRDVAGFFALPARLVFFAALIAAMISAMAVMKTSPFQKGTETARGQRLLFMILQVVTIALLIILPYGDRHGALVIGAEWLRWLGFALFIGGNLIIVSALHSLGRNYSIFVTIQEQHQLVRSGIYSSVRHPIYLGNLLSWPGMCLVFRSWLVLPVFAFFALFAVARGTQEERVLIQHFGPEYEAYRGRSWRLVPYLY